MLAGMNTFGYQSVWREARHEKNRAWKRCFSNGSEEVLITKGTASAVPEYSGSTSRTWGIREA
ncbi:hypothetical protein HMPREF0373_02113 [Eubacterium ramulus ATCC 29099]|uniref:Uncharacterized protein n=1 Tax=Eubacterium ramulus ATCC 29099 TaxID=1256908 RepID=U2PKD0_EUBRA|nr:hypothetical protein HMPREF0373_02113 [Eubacterium ramulus ATCC 29099]